MNAAAKEGGAKKEKDDRPYARTLLDTYMDGDLEYKNTQIEILKAESNYLRGDLIEQFDSDEHQNIPDLMMQLLKYHGSYQQNDREWKKKGFSEKQYSFMLRTKFPFGYCTPNLYLALDRLSGAYGNGTLRATTRQTL